MDAELKAKWVAALRSGEYKQGEANLRRDGRHCCLGILCELAPPHDEYGEWWQWGIKPFKEQWGGVALDYATALELSRMNDRGTPFGEIADYIEAYL